MTIIIVFKEKLYLCVTSVTQITYFDNLSTFSDTILKKIIVLLSILTRYYKKLNGEFTCKVLQYWPIL